jgi:hypothetical protein
MVSLSLSPWYLLLPLCHLPCFWSQPVASTRGLPVISSAVDFDYDLRIAYVGNSYTFRNGGIPAAVGGLVSLSSSPGGSSGGVVETAILPPSTLKPLTYGAVNQTGSGRSFANQTRRFVKNTEIFDGTKWDWVVFQDNSATPVRSLHRFTVHFS